MQFRRVAVNGNGGAYTQFTTTSTPGVNVIVTNTVACHFVYGAGLDASGAATEETNNRYYYNPATGTQTFANVDLSYIWVRANGSTGGHANYQVQ